VPEEQLDWWAAAADVLVLPYRHGSHSGVLHRGLAVGTPVLASPPLAEEVHRSSAGRVVPLDAALWSEMLTEVLGEYPLPRPPRPGGRLTVSGTIAVYQQVLAARSRSDQGDRSIKGIKFDALGGPLSDPFTDPR
jgi:glycosyltransferase involved in cell wall biosynthesis